MLSVPTSPADRNRAGRLLLATVTDDELALRTVIAELDEQGAPCGLILALGLLGARLLHELPSGYLDAVRREIGAELVRAGPARPGTPT